MKNKKAFTLIELLIVIAIIGILASIVLVSLASAREKAKISVAKKEMQSVSRMVEMARLNTDQTFAELSGSGCSECACVEDPPYYKSVDHATCSTRWSTALSALGAAANVSNYSDMLYDPWGSPYSADENEGEVSGDPCRQDRLISFGPDRVARSGDEIFLYIPFHLTECL